MLHHAFRSVVPALTAPWTSAGRGFARAFLLLFLSTGVQRGVAQTYLDSGPRAAALGNAVAAMPDETSARANPASWGTLKQPMLEVFASEAFGLRALRLTGVRLVMPTTAGTMGIEVRAFGSDAYRQTVLEAGYAVGLRPSSLRRLFIGTRVSYESVAIPSYGAFARWRLQVGCLLPISPSLMLGASTEAILAPASSRKKDDERVLALGLGYRPSSRLLVLLDAFKDVRYPISLRSGVEARLTATFSLRVGTTTAPYRLTMGAGLHPNRLRVDVAAERHSILGWSPCVGMSLTW